MIYLGEGGGLYFKPNKVWKAQTMAMYMCYGELSIFMAS